MVQRPLAWQNDAGRLPYHCSCLASIFTTRSVRRLPDPWNLDYASKVESMPSDFGYAALGSKLVMAKRVLPPQPHPVELPIDFSFALSRQPPTPDEAAIETQTPAPPELPEQPASSSADTHDATSSISSSFSASNTGRPWSSSSWKPRPGAYHTNFDCR